MSGNVLPEYVVDTTYDDDYKKINGYNPTDIIPLLQKFHKLGNPRHEVDLINKGILNNPDNKISLSIDFIRYVGWLLGHYDKSLESIRKNQEYIYTREDSVEIINYKKIGNEELKKTIECIVDTLRHLTEIDLDIKVSIDGNPISIDGGEYDKLFKKFGIKETTDLAKFTYNSEGGSRKKRRRKTSKVTKKHRKSSRRHRRRRN